MYPSTMSDYLVRSSMEERLRHAEATRRAHRLRRQCQPRSAAARGLLR